MDIQQQTKNVAAQGRYGDSMLLHVNPAEVKGLAQAMPITVNPDTGQPEAFLPFLAPILGSLAGSALFTGAGAGALGGLIGSSGLSSLAAGAIGSGLAQTAVTGDVKKGLMAGLTGYGVGSMLQGAAGAAGATEGIKSSVLANPEATMGLDAIGSQTLSSVGEDALGQALTSEAGKSAINAAVTNPNSAITSANSFSNLGSAVGDGQTLAQGGSNLMAGLMKPSAYIPMGVGMGTTGIMESQEEYERMLAQMDLDEEERKRKMYEKYPEQIPMAEGGRTGFRRGGNFGNNNFGRFQNSYDNVSDMFDNLRGRGGGGGQYNQTGTGYNYGGYGGYNAPMARRTRQIPGGFMPGFMPEFSYFESMNPTATDIQGSNPYATPNTGRCG